MDPLIGVLVFIIILAIGYYLTPAPIPAINCVQSPWGECDQKTLTQVRSVVTPQSGTGAACGISSQPCLPPPKLQANALQWQDNCPPGGDCSGLVWNSVGPSPWNKYYKLSCQKGEVESPMVGPFGPVGNNYFNNPKLRLGPNGQNNGCNPYNTNIYRSTIVDGHYTTTKSI